MAPAVTMIEKWAGKEAAVSTYALSVTEAEELVRREHRKSRERRKLERQCLSNENNCNNSATEWCLLRAMNALTGLKKWRHTHSRIRHEHCRGRDQWPSRGRGDSSGGSPNSSLGWSISSFSRRSSQPTTRDSDDDTMMMLSSITSSQSSQCHHGTWNIPKIPTFNRESSKKSENNYQVWRHHINLLLEADYSKPSLKYAVISSLKGQAGDFMQTLPRDMRVWNIMQELDRFYGTMLTFNGLMNVLYTIKQESKESMTWYAVWLSSALKTIKRTFPQ